MDVCLWEWSLCSMWTTVSPSYSYQAILRSVPNCLWKGIKIFHSPPALLKSFDWALKKMSIQTSFSEMFLKVTPLQDESTCGFAVGRFFYPLNAQFWQFNIHNYLGLQLLCWSITEFLLLEGKTLFSSCERSRTTLNTAVFLRKIFWWFLQSPAFSMYHLHLTSVAVNKL